MELESIKTLYEFPHYLRAEMLPDEDTLRAAYEYEYEKTIVKREESHLEALWDYDKKNRRTNFDLLVVIAAILKSDELFERLLRFKKRQEYEHWNQIRLGNNNRDDPGETCSSNVLLNDLFDAGRKLLHWAGKNKTTDSIFETIIAFKKMFWIEEKQ